jgi:hypothetical protein
MPEPFGSPWDDYSKWRKWAYEQWYGKGSWDRGISKEEDKIPKGFQEYSKPFKIYWNDELSVGVLERNGKYVGVACLVAKEVVDKENFVRRFGLSFEKDVQWRAVSSLLDHLSRSPLFKAVLVTINEVPFKLEPDVPEELKGKLRWVGRNYNFHKKIAEGLRFGLENYPSPAHAPKQMKEEEDHARKWMQMSRSIESDIREHMKPYFLIKENLFAVALFFYVYTHSYPSFEQTVQEILSRKRAAKIEANLTYFVKCTEVKDPIILFNPEFFPLWDEVKNCYCLALSEDCAGFSCDKDVGSVLRKMFTTALEIPKEEEIEEQIHIPSEEVGVELPRRAFLGYVVESVVKKMVKKRRVYFPLDVLTGHAILFGKTRTGKSFLSLILIKEALANNIRVIAFDPHGTLYNRLGQHESLKVVFTHGKRDISDELEEIYQDASTWPETNELKLLVVLDETRLLRARNLINCLNELGKRGVGFILITQYSTSIPSEARNLGTYFIMAAMSENEIQRFKDVTLHPSSKLITRLPRAYSFVFSPYWYPEPFFIRHRKLSNHTF